MSEAAKHNLHEPEIEGLLRQELVLGDQALAGVAPVLSHMLSSPGQSLVSDDIVARMRGMLGDLARQLLLAQSRVSGNRVSGLALRDAIDTLSERMSRSTTILSHCYALAMEGLLANRLEKELGLDPVLSPLWQELIASDRDETAELAMSAMAAQARFIQSQRRMDLPLEELPADLFHEALVILGRSPQSPGPEVQFSLEAALRAEFDESVGRLGQLTRLVGAMKGAASAALSLDHGGSALFVTALAQLTRQPRELAILACHERQAARFALSLRAAGVKPSDIARQFMLLHGDFALPEGFDELTADQARDVLASSTVRVAR